MVEKNPASEAESEAEFDPRSLFDSEHLESEENDPDEPTFDTNTDDSERGSLLERLMGRIEGFYYDRNLFVQFILASGFSEAFFLAANYVMGSVGNRLPRWVGPVFRLPGGSEPLVSMAGAFIGVYALFQWLQLKQRPIIVAGQEGFSSETMRGGIISGAVIGGSVGILFGFHGTAIGVGVGAVVGGEIERRVSMIDYRSGAELEEIPTRSEEDEISEEERAIRKELEELERDEVTNRET